VIEAALAVEQLKLRRSALVRTTTALLVLGVPALVAGLSAAATRAAPGSALAVKAGALGAAQGWPAYLGLVGQALAVAALLGTGVVVAWCFGREFTDGTITSLFALPVSRAATATAKCAVLTAWGLAVVAAVPVVAVLGGLLIGLGAPGADALAPGLRAAAVGALSVLLAQPVGLAASAGRGPLPAVGALLLVVVLTQVVTALGAGAWFPYAAPGLWAGAGGPQAADGVRALHLALVPLVALIGHVATATWWARAQVV